MAMNKDVRDINFRHSIVNVCKYMLYNTSDSGLLKLVDSFEYLEHLYISYLVDSMEVLPFLL